MKPIQLAACALAVSAMLAGCSNQMETETTSAPELTGAAQAEAEGIYTGQVTSIEDGIVTLALGELNQPKPPEGEPGQAPGEGETPPEESGTAGNRRKQAPEKPDGEQDDLPFQGEAETPPEMPQGGAGNRPGLGAFTVSGETVTLDLSAAVITLESDDGTSQGALEDIAAGDILTVEAPDGAKAQSVVVRALGGPGGGFGGSGEVNQGTAAHTIDTDEQQTETSYTSTGDDENALRIDGNAGRHNRQ